MIANEMEMASQKSGDELQILQGAEDSFAEDCFAFYAKYICSQWNTQVRIKNLEITKKILLTFKACLSQRKKHLSTLWNSLILC